MNQLPAYLAQIQSTGLAARAAEGIGSSLPPHISIGSNTFTMVDSAGNEQQAQTTFLDVCIADISDVMCKMYYGDANGPKKWTPGSTDPPACWSANGVAPSTEAISPQSPRCDTCRWNQRGTATSLEGKPTKACRDEKRMAVLVQGVPIGLQFTLTPGSFVNFRDYTEMFKGKPIDMCHVFTRLQFEQGASGILTFSLSPLGYIDEATAGLYVKARNNKEFDMLVGRNDRPRLAAGEPARQIAARTDTTVLPPAQMQAQPQGFQPAPFAAPPDANVAAAPQPNAQTAEAPRRRRRTAEQIAADNAAANAGKAPAASGGQAGGAFAGFGGAPVGGPTAAPFAQPAPAAGGFGIQNAPPPPSDLNASLDALFGGQGGQ